MSTILDALRKVEEEKRTQEADLRARLLSSSASRFDFRTRRYSRMPWIVGGGLVAIGAVLGAGMMIWRISGPFEGASAVVPAIATTSAPPVASVTPQQPETPIQPPTSPTAAHPEAVKPPPRVQSTPNTPKLVLPKAPHASAPPPASQPSRNLGVAEPFPQYDMWSSATPQAATVDNSSGQRGSAPAQSGEVIHRSPFVNSSPPDRSVAPPPVPPPSTPRVVATPKAPAQHAPVADEKRGKVSAAPALRNDATQTATRSRTALSPAASQEEPVGAPPGTSLSFLQWSADPEKRVASIKVGSGPATIAHEGDSIDGMTIEKIRPDAVELRSGGSRYLLKAR